jgi:hypothetical protein
MKKPYQIESQQAVKRRRACAFVVAPSGSLQDNSEFLGKLFLRNVLQVMPGMT